MEKRLSWLVILPFFALFLFVAYLYFGAPKQIVKAQSTTPVATPDPMNCNAHFSDIQQGDVFYQGIYCLACRGIVGGYDDGTFRSENTTTRGQFSKMIANGAGFSEDPGTQIFSDVPPEDTFYPYINRLARRGILGGYPCGGTNPQTNQAETCDSQNRPYFRTGNYVSRGQAAKILVGAAGYNETVTGQTFADVLPTDTFYQYIERLASRGIMTGYACGGTNSETGASEPCDSQNRPYFRAGSNLTRGQATKIVSNAFFPNCQFNLVITPAPSGSCPLYPQGDANCDNVINIQDYTIWKGIYAGTTDPSLNFTADFNSDNATDLIDFEIWREHSIEFVPVPTVPAPTSTPTQTNATPTPSPTGIVTGQTIKVCLNQSQASNCDFVGNDAIADAVNSVSAGGSATINIVPATYPITKTIFIGQGKHIIITKDTGISLGTANAVISATNLNRPTNTFTFNIDGGADVTISHLTLSNNTASPAVAAFDPGTMVTLTDNEFSSNGSYAIHAVSNTNTTILRNVIKNNLKGIGIASGATDIEENFIYGNQGVGLDLGSAATTINANVIYNTFYNNASSSDQAADASTINLSNISQGALRSNIIAHTNWGVNQNTNTTASISIRSNDVFQATSGNYQNMADQTGQNGNISSDPLFLDPAGGDFHTQSGSPASAMGAYGKIF